MSNHGLSVDTRNGLMSTLTFTEFLDGVLILTDLEHRSRRLEFSFQFCDLSNNGFISREDLQVIMNMFSIMHTGQRVCENLDV